MLHCPNQIGPYRLSGLLGRGGMGDVFRGFHQLLRRPVALKRIQRSKSEGEVARRRLLFEAQTVARLNHPSIVQVYDFLEHQGDDWIVMELVEGRTLREALGQEPMPWRAVVAMTRAVAEGLAASHSIGILHRDLKAENVLLVKDGGVKLLDFGLAKDFQTMAGDSCASLSSNGEILGTPRSMSPEQARGEALDPRSDLFSFGVLLYECLSGTSPFTGETLLATLQNVCGRQPVPVEQHAPETPAPLCRLIDSLLQKDPQHRPPSARFVAEQLAEIAGVGAPPDVGSSASATLRDPWGHLRSMSTVGGSQLAADQDLEPTSPFGRGRESRHITILSCEIRGLELPVAVDELPRLRSRVTAWCRRSGGVLARASNRRLVVAFGSLVAHEDDALRAVELGLRWLRETTDPNRERLLCAVVHAGPAIVHRHRRPSDGIELDELLDQASKLADRADHGQIVISGAVRALMASGSGPAATVHPSRPPEGQTIRRERT